MGLKMENFNIILYFTRGVATKKTIHWGELPKKGDLDSLQRGLGKKQANTLYVDY